MKIYCSSCGEVRPVLIDNCRDAKTNEPFQDIVCSECRLVIASGTDIEREPPKFPTMLRKMWSGTEVQEWINENWNKR